MLITFKHKPYNSCFEFSSNRILTKNPNLIFFGRARGGGGGGVQGQGIKERGERGRQSKYSYERQTLNNSFALNFY